MIRRYYSSRNKPKNLTLEELYQKLQHLYLFFRDKDFFEGKAGIAQMVAEAGFRDARVEAYPQQDKFPGECILAVK